VVSYRVGFCCRAIWIGAGFIGTDIWTLGDRSVLSKSKRQEEEYEKNTAALVRLRKQGVALRNELLEPKDDFNWKNERKKFVRWSNRVVKHLKASDVSIEHVAWFETLGKYNPKGPIGASVTDEGQIKLTTMYNEKIERLEKIMDVPPIPPQDFTRRP
jgi:hypothetical protein